MAKPVEEKASTRQAARALGEFLLEGGLHPGPAAKMSPSVYKRECQQPHYHLPLGYAMLQTKYSTADRVNAPTNCITGGNLEDKYVDNCPTITPKQDHVIC